MDPERMIADLEARSQDILRRSQEMQDQIRQTAATASSTNGAVTATVAPNGALQNIEFTPRAVGLTHVQLTQVVMEAVSRAQQQAAQQVAAIVDPEFGGTEAMDFLTSFLPQPEDEPQPPTGRRRAPQQPGDDEDGFGSVLR
ncbi:YbaB/EbfC family nucleoid-associated protein [Lentzea tibetensis]|uniref:YbaB/EbfC family nucleoid-associated protein n=1 Tax=Lentzea tibetensis TaxID=2591470 RepID=UPI0016484F0E|nr:YbaB/EbfC family nucleoid-associated protein [Lentzea tibetensis]